MCFCRFDLHYYTCGGTHSLLSVDTRYNEDEMHAGSGKEDFSTAPPLEKLVHTKLVSVLKKRNIYMSSIGETCDSSNRKGKYDN